MEEVKIALRNRSFVWGYEEEEFVKELIIKLGIEGWVEFW